MENLRIIGELWNDLHEEKLMAAVDYLEKSGWIIKINSISYNGDVYDGYFVAKKDTMEYCFKYDYKGNLIEVKNW